jgi:hypothetical protein
MPNLVTNLNRTLVFEWYYMWFQERIPKRDRTTCPKLDIKHYEFNGQHKLGGPVRPQNKHKNLHSEVTKIRQSS